MSDNDYEVGRNKTPVSTRYQKGQSGNPAGRTKGSGRLSMLAKLDNELMKKITILEGGKEIRVQKIEAYIKRVVNNAINGDGRATTTLAHLMPMLEKYQVQKKHEKSPEIRITFVEVEDTAKKRAYEVAQRMINEARAVFLETGAWPDIPEPVIPIRYNVDDIVD